MELYNNLIKETKMLLDGSFDICVFDVVNLNEAGQTLSYDRGSEREGLFTFAEYPELLFTRPNACNKLWRRSLFTASGVRFPDRLWFEDLATVPRLYLHAERFRALNRPWYLYLRRGDSIMSSRGVERNLEMITALDTVLRAYREAGLLERYHDELEYLALYHQLLTSCVRVAQLDPHSSVLPRLAEDFQNKFPRFRSNPYLRGMSAKHRLLLALILRRRFGAVKSLMAVNRRVRRRA